MHRFRTLVITSSPAVLLAALYVKQPLLIWYREQQPKRLRCGFSADWSNYPLLCNALTARLALRMPDLCAIQRCAGPLAVQGSADNEYRIKACRLPLTRGGVFAAAAAAYSGEGEDYMQFHYVQGEQENREAKEPYEAEQAQKAREAFNLEDIYPYTASYRITSDSSGISQLTTRLTLNCEVRALRRYCSYLQAYALLAAMRPRRNTDSNSGLSTYKQLQGRGVENPYAGPLSALFSNSAPSQSALYALFTRAQHAERDPQQADTVFGCFAYGAKDFTDALVLSAFRRKSVVLSAVEDFKEHSLRVGSELIEFDEAITLDFECQPQWRFYSAFILTNVSVAAIAESAGALPADETTAYRPQRRNANCVFAGSGIEMLLRDGTGKHLDGFLRVEAVGRCYGSAEAVEGAMKAPTEGQQRHLSSVEVWSAEPVDFDTIRAFLTDIGATDAELVDSHTEELSGHYPAGSADLQLQTLNQALKALKCPEFGSIDDAVRAADEWLGAEEESAQ